jgi:Zn-dependent peptidase ImmA (M78 family)
MPSVSDAISRSGKSLERISRDSGIHELRLRSIAGGAEPNLRELREISSALKVRLTDLTSVSTESGPTAFLFRQTMGEVKPRYVPAVNLLAWQMEKSLDMLGSNESPVWPELQHRAHETYKDAEQDAEAFRKEFFSGDLVSPMLRLPRIAVDEMDVMLLVASRQEVDGASAIVRGTPFVFVSPRFPPRMLFTLAHEIGHLVAHHKAGSEFAVFDAQTVVNGIRPRKDRRERFADAFASCLLLPAAGIGIVLKKVRELYKIPEAQPLGDIEILYLARIFGVSFQVAAKRCEDIDLLPSGGAVSLYEEICKQHGSPEKRAEELGLPPRPEIDFPSVPARLLEAAVERIKRGEISVGRASASLNVSISELMAANREFDA